MFFGGGGHVESFYGVSTAVFFLLQKLEVRPLFSGSYDLRSNFRLALERARRGCDFTML